MSPRFALLKKYPLIWKLAMSLLVLLTLLMAACGTNSPPSTPSPTPTTAAAASPAVTSSAHANLAHVPNGRAELSWDQASQRLKVTLTMGGLAPDSTHPTELRLGSCSHPGQLLYQLKNTASDAAGNGSETSVVEHVAQNIPASGWYIVLHNGPLLQTADEVVAITCGDVAHSGTPQIVQ